MPNPNCFISPDSPPVTPPAGKTPFHTPILGRKYTPAAEECSLLLANAPEAGGETAELHPPFPLQALPEFMRRMAEAGAMASNSPVTLTAPLVLAAHSLALGAGVELSCGGVLRCRGNLHLLGIGESGTGKSEAARIIFAPLYELQRERLEAWDSKGRSEQKARIVMLKNREKEVQNDPLALASVIQAREMAELKASDGGRPLLFASNVTREALASALAMGPGQAFAVLNPDARGLLGVIAGKYSSGKSSDEDIYLAGFSGDAMSSLRVGSGFVHLHSPCLTTCMLIQPDAFDSLRKKAIFAESGWLQRNLVFDSHAEFDPLPAIPPVLPYDIATAWKEHIRDLVEMVRDARETTLIEPTMLASSMMLERANAVRARIKSGELRDMASFACRWAEQANRIALNLHAARYPDPREAALCYVSDTTIEKAWTIAGWFAQEQVRLLSSMREEKRHARCERLLTILSRQGPSKLLPRWKLIKIGFTEEELLLLARLYPSRLLAGELPNGPAGGRPLKWIRAL
ncbi:MAG TPA: DUF3987 domain-containing protein [Verrucomicrobiales bacterium]|nr:DUF3987 domain-containing protein [Verrucomicrobiales bacterium]